MTSADHFASWNPTAQYPTRDSGGYMYSRQEGMGGIDQ